MHVYLSFIYLNPSFVFCFQLNNFSLMVCDTIFWIQIATRLRYPRIKSLFQFFSFVSLGFFLQMIMQSMHVYLSPSSR